MLERREAVELLKELVASNSVVSSVVSIDKNKRGSFSLTLKVDFDSQTIRQFIAGKNLICHEDSVKGYCTISKP